MQEDPGAVATKSAFKTPRRQQGELVEGTANNGRPLQKVSIKAVGDIRASIELQPVFTATQLIAKLHSMNYLIAKLHQWTIVLDAAVAGAPHHCPDVPELSA